MPNPSWTFVGLSGLLSTFFYSTLVSAQTLNQVYCSPDNTGATYQQFYDNYQSDGSCQTHCEYGGTFAFAIVQGFYCWCSNYIPANQVSLYDCSFPCHGFPSEACGNPDTNLFGYIALSNQPYGTAGAAATTAASKNSPKAKSTTQDFQTSAAPTTTEYSTEIPTAASVKHTAPPPSSRSSTTTSTTSPSPSPSTSSDLVPSAVTSIVKVTVSGAVVTHVYTTVATAAPGSNTLPHVQAANSHGLSSGAVAGIAIGVLIAVGLIISLCIFFCWYKPRRDRDDDDDSSIDDEGRGQTPPQRESSVLSRVGLLGAGRRAPVQPPPPPPRITTTGFHGGHGHYGAETISNETASPTMSQRRNSQPMFIDNRLNTNTLMTQSNVSHTSVSTLQDHQDYSRPVLSVRNPDVYEGT